MSKDLLYAGGFPRPWKTDAEEIKSSRLDNGWHPSTADFQATAQGSGGGTAVSSLGDILGYLRSKPDGSIEELVIIGHASAGTFALGGQIIPGQGTQRGGVKFTGGHYINDQLLLDSANDIKALQKRFAANAKIKLVGCDAGLDKAFLNQMSKAFGVCVVGFSDKVWTGFSVAGDPASIVSRGHVYVDSSGLMGSGMAPDVITWSKDVGNLAPNSKSDGCP
jgi:hypothetical protein